MTTESHHTTNENPLVQASRLRKEWVEEVVEFIDDEDFGRVLDLAVQIISGDIPESAKIARVCVRLEAYALKFRTLYVTYMGPKKGTTDANMKKNHYKEMYMGIDNLVSSMKYMVKT